MCKIYYFCVKLGNLLNVMLKYKHYIFDFNGTLLDDCWLTLEVFNQMLKKRNLPEISIDNYKAFFEFPVINYYKRVGFNFEKENFDDVSKEYITAYNSRVYQLEIFEDAKYILEFIKDNGGKCHILSARNYTSLIDDLKRFEIFDYFDLIYGLKDDYAFSKMDLAKDLKNKLKLNPENSIFIGDTIHDFEASKVCNSSCILLSAGHQSSSRLLSVNKNVVENLSKIKDFIIK